MGKNLILYFSRKDDNLVYGLVKTIPKGHTEYCAEFIQKAVGGDLFEMVPYREYDEDFYACQDEASEEQANRARPELLYYLQDLEKYDTVFLCSPIWWGTLPMPVFTQLERLDWRGKKVHILVTQERSGLGFVERDLIRACRGAQFGGRLAVRGSEAPDSEELVAAWAEEQMRETAALS